MAIFNEEFDDNVKILIKLMEILEISNFTRITFSSTTLAPLLDGRCCRGHGEHRITATKSNIKNVITANEKPKSESRKMNSRWRQFPVH